MKRKPFRMQLFND